MSKGLHENYLQMILLRKGEFYLFFSSNQIKNSCIFSSHSEPLPLHCSKKYILFEECLLSRFVHCRKCGQEPTQVITKIMGTYAHVEQCCSICLNVSTWDSQPFVKSQPAGNSLLSTSILFTGALRTTVLRVFQNMGCATITKLTFSPTSEWVSSHHKFCCLGETSDTVT